MGQYQQWLLLREADQRLRAQLAALEAELAQLQDRADRLEQTFSPADNLILRILTASLNGQAPPESTGPIEAVESRESSDSTKRAENAVGESTSSPTLTADRDATPGESIEAATSALFAWGNLPNFAPQDIQPSLSGEDGLSPPLPDTDERALLPEDMKPFFDEYGQTEPQIEIPWWLHSVLASAGAAYPSGPIDPESFRTNRLVQRWLERWKKQPASPQTSGED